MNTLPLDTAVEIVRLRYVTLAISLCQLHREIRDTEAALHRCASETGRVVSVKYGLQGLTVVQGRRKSRSDPRPEKRARR